MTRTPKARDKVLEAARTVQRRSPEILKPIADCFGVNIEERLENPKYREGLCYAEY